MSEETYKQALIRAFGEQIIPHMEKLNNRIALTVAATLYGHVEGQTNLDELQKFFDALNL